MESPEDKISPEKKKRRMKTSSQVEGLENFYGRNKYPSEAMKTQLSIELGLSKQQVVAWFAHRRSKDKGQDPQNGLAQDYPQSYLTFKQSGNPEAMNGTNYPATLLPSDHGNMEHAFARSSQERSPLPFGNPKEIGITRCFSHNGNRCGMEGVRKKREGFHMNPQLKENYEHVAIIAVKKQLGEEYRDDGPPLSVEFDLIPPGAFDAPIGPYYRAKSNDTDRRLKILKEHERYNVPGGDSFHVPYNLNSSGESPSSGFSRKRFSSRQREDERYNYTVPGRTGTMDKEMCISYPHSDIDPYYNVSGVNEVIKAVTPLAQSGDLPSSHVEDKAHDKNMVTKERFREEKRIQREQERALKAKQKLMEKEEKRIKREKEMEEKKRRREEAKCHAAAQKMSMGKNQTGGCSRFQLISRAV